MLLLAITVVITAACDSLHIEKRKYRKGFYFELFDERNHGDAKQVVKNERREQSVLSAAGPHGATHDTTAFRPDTAVASAPLCEKGSYRKADGEHIIKQCTPKRRTFAVTESKIVTEEKEITHTVPVLPLQVSLIAFLFLGIPAYLISKTELACGVSRWATKNRRKAQWSIAGLHFALAFTSFALGALLRMQQIAVPFSDACSALLLLGLAGTAFASPLLNRAGGRTTAGILFTSLLFAGSAVAGNKLAGADVSGMSWSLSDGLTSFFCHAPDDEYVMNPVAGVFLTVLMVALSLLILAGLAVLACDLVCSGYGALAFIVFFGGVYMVAFLFALGVQHIFKKVKNPYGSEEERRKAILKKALIAAFIVLGIMLSFLGIAFIA